MARWLQQPVIVACVAGIVLFTNLGGPLLWDRDEPRNAGCALEMQQRSDWITPVFNAELRSHKPVLLYWLMMTAYTAFGVTEFAARFWSAALGVGTSLCTYAIGRRLFHGSAGLWSGVAIATSLMFGIAGRAATPDSLIIFLSTLSLTIYVYGTFATGGNGQSTYTAAPRLRAEARWFPANWFVVAAMYAVMGLGVLAKGPVGVLLPSAVIGMFLLVMKLPLDGHNRLGGIRLPALVRAFSPYHFLRIFWSMRPVTGLLVTLLVAAPWYIWVGVRTDGEFLRGFFFEHNIGRAMRPMEGHDGGVLFYPGALLVGFFPWSVFALPVFLETVARTRQRDPWRTGYLLAGCWIGVYVVLFSFARTKLPSYVTPAYPGLALVTGAYVFHWLNGTLLGSQRLRRLAFGVLVVVGLVLLIALPIVAQRTLPGEEWLGMVGLVPLVGGLLAWLLMERGFRRATWSVFAATAALTMTLAFGLVAERVSRHQQGRHLLAEVDRRGQQTCLASFGLLEPTWIYYGGRSITELAWSGQAEWMGGWAEVDGGWCPKPPHSVQELSDAPEDWVIITTDDHLARLRSMLPNSFQVIGRTPYFLKDQDLVLVGRASAARVAATEGGAGKR